MRRFMQFMTFVLTISTVFVFLSMPVSAAASVSISSSPSKFVMNVESNGRVSENTLTIEVSTTGLDFASYRFKSNIKVGNGNDMVITQNPSGLTLDATRDSSDSQKVNLALSGTPANNVSSTTITINIRKSAIEYKSFFGSVWSELGSSSQNHVTLTIPVEINRKPTIDAGADQTVTLPSTLTLAGTYNDDALPSGSSVTPTWSQTGVPDTASFSNTNTWKPTVTFSKAGTYVFSLVASDGALSSAADTVTITVLPDPNKAPVVDAGADKTITLPSKAVLSGSYTDDALPVGSPVTPTWTQTSGPATATFSNTNTWKPEITFAKDGTYVFSLTASDGRLTSSADTVTITVLPDPNTAPVADAGPDKVVAYSSKVTLEGSYTDDGLPEGYKVTYRWTKVSGPNGPGFNANELQPEVTFTNVGTYVFQLIVNDGQKDSAPDTVTVTVTPGVTYSPSAFIESDDLDGSFESAVVVTLNTSNFASSASVSNITANSNYISVVSGLPSGMKLSSSRGGSGNRNKMTLTLNNNGTNFGSSEDTELVLKLSSDTIDGYSGEMTLSIPIHFKDSDRKMTYSTDTFLEKLPENDGTIDTVVTVSLTGSGIKFKGTNGSTLTTQIRGSNNTSRYVYFPNLPAGLSAEVKKVDDLNVTIKLTNRATNHTNVDSLNHSFSIQFNTSAFTAGTAAMIDGSTRDDLSITFYDPVAMTYEPGSFTEAPINDGSITDTKTIFLEGASFRNGEFEDADYSSNCSSILPGLRLKLYRVSEHQAMIKLEGNATSHAATNSLTNLNISFRQTAFKNFTGNVAQFSKNDLRVEFIDAKPIRILEVYPSTIGGGTFNSSTGKYSSVKYQGDYKDVSAALSGLSGYEITSMSLNKFISLVEDVNGQYDIVYFGRGTYFKNAADIKRYGNDITDKRAREVLRFINSGQLCIFHPDAFKADPVDNKFDTKMYSNFYSVTKNNVIRLANGTTNPNTSNRLKDAILTYADASVTNINKKPVLSVYEKPLSYKNLTNALESRYIGYDFKVYDKEDEKVKAKLYIDRNNDSLFEEKELVEEKVVNRGQAASIIYKMPDGLTGIFFWKLEIEDSKGAKDEMVDVFRLFGDEINVKVLQIKPNSMSVNGSLTAMFNRPFDGEPGNTLGHRKGEYKVDVVEVTLDQFNAGANTPYRLGSELNAYYDMIVIGFQDSYGQNVFNTNALTRLDSFIKTNQGVMFTHDTIWDRDKTSLTTRFMDETAQTSAYNAGIVTYDSRKNSTNSSEKEYFTEVGGYSKVNDDYKLDEFRNVSPGNVATLIRKVNSAAITLYPFNLEDTPQNSMSVAPTHFQWYKLDLEQEGVIPLFNMYNSNNSERINDDGMNGFYTYSNGNITYSGTGHATASTPYPDYEVKLFVNTMMKAYSSQNHKPEIEVISPEDQKRVSAGESHVDVRFRAYDFDFGDDVLDYKVYIDRGTGYVEEGSGSMDNGSAVSLSIEKKFTNARTFMVKISVQDRGNNGAYTPAENYVELTLYNIDAPLITPSISFAKDKLLVGESINMNVSAISKGSANPTITIQPKLTTTVPKGLTYGSSRDGSTITTLTQTFSYTPTGSSPASAVVGNYSVGTYQLDQDANEKSFTFTSSIDMQNGTSANNAAGSVNVRSASLKVEAKDNFGSGNYLRDYTISGVGSARVKKVGGTYVYMDIAGGNGKEFVLNVPTGYTFERLELYRNESANPDGENWVLYNDGIPDTENRVKIDINYDNYRWKIVYHLTLNIQKVPVSYYRIVTPYNDVDFIGTDPGDLTADPLYQLPVKRGSKVLLAALFKIDPIIGTNVTDLEIGVEAKDKYGSIIPAGAATTAKILDTNITFANTADTAVFRSASTRWLKSNPDALATGTYADGTYYVLIEIPKADEQQIRMSSLKLIMDNGSTPTFYTSEIGLISITDLEVPPLR